MDLDHQFGAGAGVRPVGGDGPSARGRERVVPPAPPGLAHLGAALAGLELAVLYLEEGGTAEVRKLAEELLAIFKAQKVHHHALAALTLFCKATRTEEATMELARRLGDYLYGAQHRPEL